MPQTYNDMVVPTTINPRMIISAFTNEIDSEKVEDFTQVMQSEMLSHTFPPIKGFPTIIDEDDLEGWFVDGRSIPETCLGKLAWKVTDGHHRSLAAIAARLPYVETTLDYTAITNEKDFGTFNTSH